MELNQHIKKTLDSFSSQLKAKLGPNLESVVLYGSAVNSAYSNKLSDINILIILKNTDIESLRGIALIRKNHKFFRISPLVFTKEYMDNSTDTFPMEFIDIKENHLVLYGQDYLKHLEINEANLRHQCEWELKSKIIRMQRFYMHPQKNKKAINDFLLKGLPSLLVLFKNILKLKDIQVSDKEAIIEKIGLEFHLDSGTFKNIFSARLGNNKIVGTEKTFEETLYQLQRLSKAIDKIRL